MNNRFFQLGRLEGVSLLILLGVAMPLKYLAGYPLAVRIVGALHGALFLIYVTMLLDLASKEKWRKKTVILGLLGAILPMGTFYFERYITASLGRRS